MKRNMNEDLDYIIHNATKMHRVFKFSKSHIKNRNIYLKNTNYDLEVFRSLDFKVMKKFLWNYQYDYLVFGYNPHNALKKIERIMGRLSKEDKLSSA